jgi:hypothetical protein
MKKSTYARRVKEVLLGVPPVLLAAEVCLLRVADIAGTPPAVSTPPAIE